MRVVGQRTSKDTAKLIEEVARGDRLLEDIKDPELRETVRLALRLHKDPYSAPDSRTRSRIRARVLFGLRPHDATMIDRLAVVFELLGRPTPYAMRMLVVGLIVMAVAASTALVSAGTVADDALYSVKVTSEQMRLALATSPEDRAGVELSIAQHAADTADEAAAAAERKLTPARQSDASPATGGADRGTTSVDATPRDGQTARNDTTNGQGERVSKKERAAGAARKAADEAKAAAKKAKAGAKHTPAPKTRDDSNSRDD